MSLIVANASTPPEQVASLDAQIRGLLRDSAMPGWVELALTREPSYFGSLSVQGKHNQVIADVRDSQVVAMGCRSIRPVFVNGYGQQIGYLSGLRLASEFRGARTLFEGFRLLRSLHDDGRVKAYLTTIIDGNDYARRILTSRRALLPTYHDRGRYYCYAINLNRRRRPRRYSKGLQVVRGDQVPRADLIDLLATGGRRRQFFPVIEPDDLDSEYMRGLARQGFRVALHHDRIVGAIAAWDQSSFKQEIVCCYRPTVRRLRPVLNAGLRVAGYRPLPEAGQPTKTLYASFVCIEDDRPEVFLEIMEDLCQEHKGGDFHFLALGLAENDPLRPAMKGLFAFQYVSRMYLVYWEDGEAFFGSVDGNLPAYLELATL